MFDCKWRCDHQGAVLQSIFGLSGGKKAVILTRSSCMSGSCVRSDMGQYIQLCTLDGPLCEGCEWIWPAKTEGLQKGCSRGPAQHPNSRGLSVHVGEYCFPAWSYSTFFLFNHKSEVVNMSALCVLERRSAATAGEPEPIVSSGCRRPADST